MGKAKAMNKCNVSEIEQFILDAGSDSLGVFGGKYEGGIHCQQVADEMAACIAAILDGGRAIENYLEIGVAAGGTTYLFHHYFKPGTLVLVDDNQHPKASLRGQVLQGVLRQEIIGKSGSDLVRQEVAAIGTKFDLIVIDGDHTYHGVRADVDHYLPFLQAGGYMMFHDSLVPEFGVGKVVAELKEAAGLDFIGEYASQTRKPLGVALFRKDKNEDQQF